MSHSWLRPIRHRLWKMRTPVAKSICWEGCFTLWCVVLRWSKVYIMLRACRWAAHVPENEVSQHADIVAYDYFGPYASGKKGPGRCLRNVK